MSFSFLVIGGELEAGEDLLSWGFLDELVEPDRLQSRARALAEYYAQRPPLAAQMIKRGLNAMQMSPAAAIMHMDGDQFTLATESEDYQQQRDAFLNRSREQ